MLPIRAWRVFYADGSTFDSTQGSWAQAPPFGVQVVVWYHDPPYKTVDLGHSLFFFEANPQPRTLERCPQLAAGNCPLNAETNPPKMGLFMDEEGLYRIQDLAMRSTMPEVD